jgi:hypothetical protein
MDNKQTFGDRPHDIFIFCIIYALHMVEEFTLGFVQWADRYFGSFDWTQNLFGNSMFFACLAAACFLYYKNPAKYLLAGMCAAMWVLSNSFLHISATVLGGEYSPGVVTATVLYVPAGLYFLVLWGRKGLLSWKNVILSFVIGGMIFMLVPTFARAIHFNAQLARIFHLAL